MKPSFSRLTSELRSHADPKSAAGAARFFKTAPGQYGHGDAFLGLTVPLTRLIVKNYYEMPWADIAKLMKSPWHEERLAGVIIMAERSNAAETKEERAEVCARYLSFINGINNWDLVDASAVSCVGAHLADLSFASQQKFLKPLISSRNMWERRIAMISTFRLIKAGESRLALWVAERLIGDAENLMHKAVGWMLREVGKRASSQDLRNFLDAYASTMPRTALRYAIERFSESERKAYLGMRVKK